MFSVAPCEHPEAAEVILVEIIEVSMKLVIITPAMATRDQLGKIVNSLSRRLESLCSFNNGIF
jgi:hypothetical protein